MLSLSKQRIGYRDTQSIVNQLFKLCELSEAVLHDALRLRRELSRTLVEVNT